MLPAVVGPSGPATAGAAGVALYELVRRRLAGTGQLRAFEEFEARPVDGSLVRELLRQSVERDRDFAAALAAATERARAAAPATSSAVHIETGTMTGDFQIAGRDNTETVNRRTVIDSGGLLLSAAVVIALLIAAAVLLLPRG